ncbi:MAG: hypothetical protein R3F43_20390 [bacterium]
MSGINRVLGVREGAVVLAQHPGREAGGAPAPVIVAQEFGQGRVLAVTTDSTWSWAFQAAADGGDNRHYYKLWGNAIRWLIQDPALKPVRVEADRDRYPLGTEVTLLTRVVAPTGPRRGHAGDHRGAPRLVRRWRPAPDRGRHAAGGPYVGERRVPLATCRPSRGPTP